MRSALRYLSGVSLLIGMLAVVSVVSAQPTIPPFDRNEPPGQPPGVPGYDKLPPLGVEKSDKTQPLEKDAPEVEGRGPVHEGFAQPGQSPRPGEVVPKAPPTPIEELPPEEKPEGAIWVPGYWSWDADRNDFLWVSGFWRIAPAGRKWLPGYWSKTERGYQWVSGFWAPAKQQEMPYVPEAPPDSLDRGPSVPAPGEGYEYVPGNWNYQEQRWRWQPGVWYQPRPGLVWCPPRWCWTPRGHLFVNGYWDACLEDRGILFAPVYFSSPIYRRPGYVFRPYYAVPTRGLLASLWIRPGGGSYAYGDFYAGRYARAGYQPWAVSGRGLRDPLFGYYRWSNRDNPAWQRGLVTTYRDRIAGDAILPPRTLAAQQQLATRNRSLAANLEVARPLDRYSSGNLKLTRQTQQERTIQQRQAESLRAASTQRRVTDAPVLPRNERRVLKLDTKPSERSTEPKLEFTPRNQSSARLNTVPSTTPRLTTPPRVEVAPKTNVTPRNSTSPKIDSLPRRIAPAPPTPSAPVIRPAPKVAAPAPVIRPAPPAPKIQSAPAPRSNPAAVMRSSPAPAPKISPAPVRSAPSPRSSPAPVRSGNQGNGKR